MRMFTGTDVYALTSLESERAREAIIALAREHCGLEGDVIRQLATALVADGYRKFEIVDEEQ